MEYITYDDFEKVDIRSGTIISVEDFPKARNQLYVGVFGFRYLQ